MNSKTVSDAPTGIAVFANDFQSIRLFSERDNTTIIQWSEYERGGHFAAIEVPDIQDLKKVLSLISMNYSLIVDTDKVAEQIGSLNALTEVIYLLSRQVSLE